MLELKKIIQRFLGIDIIQVFSLNALSTAVRMLAGMISVKLVAVIIGPAGIALLGQLENLKNLAMGLAGGINSGVTKYVAEFKNDDIKVRGYISNATYITITSTLIVALVMILGSNMLSQRILMSTDFNYVFIIFGVTIIFYTLNALLIAILNGYKEFRKYVIVNICGTIVGLIYSVSLVCFWGLKGAMINAVTFQSIMFFVTLWMCRKLPWMSREYFTSLYNKLIVKDYIGYYFMSVISLSVLPISQIFLRGYVISELSAVQAGIWEGMNRISGMYLGIITSAFSIYFLPRLSEITDKIEMHNEIFRCCKIVLPILILISAIIYILRDFILWFLFTPDFYPMESLFIWQLAGDFFKMCSWFLGILMVAKAKTIMFISTEIIFSLSYLILSFLFLRMNGTLGLVQGYLCNYILYLSLMIMIFRDVIKVKT